MIITVRTLIWDKWNREHIARHGVTPEEVEEVCYGRYKARITYRSRIELKGSTEKERKLVIILSPENRALQIYGEGIYYPITAFEEKI